MAQPESSYQVQLTSGIFSEAYRLGYDVLIFSSFIKKGGSIEFQRGEKQIYHLAAPNNLYDAIIVVPDVIQIDGALDYINKNILEHFNGPIVYVDYHDENKICICEDSDRDFQTIVDHLYIEHNCRSFAYMLGFENHDHSISRMTSITKALSKYHITPKEENIFYGDFWYDKGAEFADQLIGDGELPDAVICISDPMAISLINALKKRVVSVPQDIIVTGFDAEISGMDEPYSITSIMINHEANGVMAVRKIAQLLDNATFDKDVDKSGKLILNNTCSCKSNVAKKIISVIDIPVSAYDGDTSFYSGFNFMNEELIGSMNLHDLLWKIKFFTYYIAGDNNICLCLNDIFHRLENGEQGIGSSLKYTDRIYPSLDLFDKDIVDMNRNFPLSSLYPKLSFRHNTPCLYHFLPLHFNQTSFGYLVIESTNPRYKINTITSQWTRYCTLAFESLKRQQNLKIMYRKFEESTIKDLSTGLFSRNGFYLYADDMLKTADSMVSCFTMILGDLNCLKHINDEYGHSEGDLAIVTAAKCFSQPFGSDVIFEEKNFRIGGDEFVKIVVGVVSEEEIHQYINRVNEQLNQYNKTAEKKYPIILSVGYCTKFPGADDSIDSILQQADKMMFANKKIIKEKTGFDFSR